MCICVHVYIYIYIHIYVYTHACNIADASSADRFFSLRCGFASSPGGPMIYHCCN